MPIVIEGMADFMFAFCVTELRHETDPSGWFLPFESGDVSERCG